MLRSTLLCVLLTGFSGLEAQRLLLALPRAEAPPEALVIGARITVPDVKPAARSDASTILVLADLLTAEDRPLLFTELKRRFTATRQKEQFTVIVVRGQEMTPLPPARQYAALEKELLALLEAVPGQTPPPVNAAPLYDLLLGAIPPETEAWREVLWAGRLPGLPAGLLRDFARARIQRQLAMHRCLLRVWPAPEEPWLPVQEIPPDTRLYEVNWTAEAAPRGFEMRPVELDGVTYRYLAVAEGFSLPTLEQMGRLTSALTQARAEGAGAAALAELRAAVQIYPLWLEAHVAGAALAEKLNDPASAAFFLEPLARDKPDDPDLLRRYALALAFSAPAATAEPVLQRAIAAHPRDAVLLERFGRAQLEHGDRAAAYRRFQESLALAPDNTNLWWVRADLARDLADTPGEREALRQALRGDPARTDRRARQIQLALDAADGAEARQALEAAGDIPRDTTLLAQYAGFWEKLAEPARALPLWRRSTAADPAFEPGWVAVARLELAAQRPAESLEAAAQGLAQLPKSAPLHAARVQALVSLGRVQEARRLLRAATESSDDLTLTRQEAEVQDLFGGDAAAAAWTRYLDRAARQQVPAQELANARGRAVRSALRDGDPARAARLLDLPEKPLPTEASKSERTGIPGGVRALAYLSGISGSKDPERYLNEFARAIAQRSQIGQKQDWEEQTTLLLDNYTRLIQLRQLGKPTNGGALVTLQPGNKADRQRTQQALELLGYRMRTAGGKLQIEAGVKKQQGRRQSLAAALDIDEDAMEKSLESGKPFDIRVTDDFAEVVLGERAWSVHNAKYGNSLGFAGLFVKEPQLARLYAGLTAAGPRAAEALQNRIGLKVLAENYADLLFLYGPALALNSRGECPAPGGPAAEAAWRQLTGRSPKQGTEFIDILVRKDEGMLLAFFATLHAVTAPRQRWFLQSPDRASLFYELMRDAPEWKIGAGKRIRKSAIVDLFRTLPLNAAGEVRFPGGPQVWQVAKGTGDVDRVARLAQKAEAARPAEEEALLARMAQQRYQSLSERFSLLENMLAVAQVEDALGRELTPREALVLSQHFGEFEWSFPFFTALPGLSDKEFTAFFSWVENWPQKDMVESSLLLGIFENIVLLEGLLVRAGALDGPASAEIFRLLCEKLRAATTREAAAAAAQEALRRLSTALRAPPGQLRATLEDRLFGPADRPWGRLARKEYRTVLKLQKCPDLDALLELLDAVLAAAQGPAPTLAAAARLEQILPALETVALPKGEQVDGAVRHLLDVWKTAQLAKLPREMREKASKKKPNPRDFARLAAEMREELAPWLELSLRGAVLAFYLRGEDLPVSEDALLLRKYQYRAASETDKHLFPPPEFTAASDGAGSTPSGSLAGMAEIAGRVAVAGRRGAPGFAEAVESKQIGSLRNSFLWRVDEEAIRALHLSVLAGREWLVDAAASEPEAEALLEACEGLVSPERQTHLEEILTALRGLPAPPAQPNAKPLADRESFTALWEELWEQLSVSDLFWLGRQRRAAPPESLAWKALSQLPASVFAGRIQELGGLTLEHARSSRPRLAPHPAYEDYAAQMMPARLAERLSELPFALACAVDEAGLPAEALALTAEPLSRNLFETLSMSDLADFRSVLALWRKVDSTLVRALYEEEMTKIP